MYSECLIPFSSPLSLSPFRDYAFHILVQRTLILTLPRSSEWPGPPALTRLSPYTYFIARRRSSQRMISTGLNCCDYSTMYVIV